MMQLHVESTNIPTISMRHSALHLLQPPCQPPTHLLKYKREWSQVWKLLGQLSHKLDGAQAAMAWAGAKADVNVGLHQRCSSAGAGRGHGGVRGHVSGGGHGRGCIG
eukprot:9475308-Pyramimonas_sp.AAC.1